MSQISSRKFVTDKKIESSNKGLPVNKDIKALKIQLISSSGENLGVVTTESALRQAELENLDLVIVSETGAMDVPVAKLINLNKKLYEEKKKNKASKKNEIQMKEIRFSPKIGDHDLMIKLKNASEHLLKGARVKFVLTLKGRERALRDTFGKDLFIKIENFLNNYANENSKYLAIDDSSDSANSSSKTFYFKKTGK